MLKLFLIFIGGGVGSVFRFVIGQFVVKWIHTPFPVATCFINITGSFLIGFFYALSARSLIDDNLRLLLGVGLCGGFTTFSTFSFESLQLLQKGEYWNFAGYALLSIVLCVLFVWIGDMAGQLVFND